MKLSTTSTARSLSSAAPAPASGLRPGRRSPRRRAIPCLPTLLEDVVAGRIKPRRVFDFDTDPEGIGDAYAAIDERRAIKALVRIGVVERSQS
jgi:hypothetical protein